MDTLTKRQELHKYIDEADEVQVVELYAKITEEANEPYEWWNDEGLVAELERRSADLESGKVKGIPWEEVKNRLLKKELHK